MFCKVSLGKLDKPDHQFFTGDGLLLSADIKLTVDQEGSSCNFSIFDINGVIAAEYFTLIFDEDGLEPPIIDLSRFKRIGGDDSGDDASSEAIDTVIEATNNSLPQSENINSNVKAGQQITIELGDHGVTYLKYQFLHDSISYDWVKKTLKFGGSVASKMLCQYPKNTAYEGLTFHELAKNICESYGLKAILDDTGNNPEYKYIPQIGMTDYEFLLYEAKRLGYRVTTKGDTISFDKPELKGEELNEHYIRAVYAENLVDFTLRYQVETSGSSNIRASIGSDSSTGFQRKWKINDDGLMEPIRQEIETVETSEISTTGSAIEPVNPSEKEDENATDIENEKRVKGVIMSSELVFDPNSAKLDPTIGIQTDGLESEVYNRVWIPERVSFEYRNNVTRVFATAYSPLKPKYEQIAPPPSVLGDDTIGTLSPVLGSGSVNALIIQSVQELGGFSSRSGPGGGRVACVWAINRLFSNKGITPIWGGSLNVEFAGNAMASSPNGVEVPVGQEQPGDFTMVLRGSAGGHIGVVISSGTAKSNSSSRAAFVWVSDLFFSASYAGAYYRKIWRDTRTF